MQNTVPLCPVVPLLFLASMSLRNILWPSRTRRFRTSGHPPASPATCAVGNRANCTVTVSLHNRKRLCRMHRTHKFSELNSHSQTQHTKLYSKALLERLSRLPSKDIPASNANTNPLMRDFHAYRRWPLATETSEGKRYIQPTP
jgi:hypothetical protein